MTQGFDPSRSFLPAQTTKDDAQSRSLASSWLCARSRNRARRRLSGAIAGSWNHNRALPRRIIAWPACSKRWAVGRSLRAFHQGTRSRRAADSLPDRFQHVYHEVAAHHDCILVDGQALFHAFGVHGLLDDHLFHDGMHPSLRGHIALAQGDPGCDSMHAGPWDWRAEKPPHRAIGIAECAAHFGVKPKDWRHDC